MCVMGDPIHRRVGDNNRRYQKMFSSLRRFSRDEVARQRLRIMEFYDRYGDTKEALETDRKVVSR